MPWSVQHPSRRKKPSCISSLRRFPVRGDGIAAASAQNESRRLLVQTAGPLLPGGATKLQRAAALPQHRHPPCTPSSALLMRCGTLKAFENVLQFRASCGFPLSLPQRAICATQHQWHGCCSGIFGAREQSRCVRVRNRCNRQSHRERSCVQPPYKEMFFAAL